MNCNRRVAGPVFARRWIARVGLILTAVAALAIGAVPAAFAATYTVPATITVGTDAYMAAVDPTTNTIYVTNGSTDSVTVINGVTNTVVTTVPVGHGPQEIAVNPSNHRVYVSNAMDNTVSVIDGTTNTVTATVPVGLSPSGVAVNASTNTAYVANGVGTVSVIDGTNTVTATVAAGMGAAAVAHNPMTNTIYVANQSADTVTVIDGTTNGVTTTISLPGSPAAIAVNPTTNSVYVNIYAPTHTVVVIDGSTNTVTTTSIPVAGNGWGLGVDAGTNTIYLTDPFDDTVLVIDGATGAVVATLPVGASPTGLAVNPATHTAYVANNGDGTVSVIRRAAPAPTTTRPSTVVSRVAGADRYSTAVAASQATFAAGGAGAVVLASGTNYPDALVGSPLANVKNAPLLLTAGATLPAGTMAELTRVLPAGGNVYVLGGTAAVPASVTTQLTTLGYNVTRIGGADRYRTAVAVAAALGDPTTFLLASGTAFPDALVASPAAAHVHGAVLLTNGDEMVAATSDRLSAFPGEVYAIGGSAAAAWPAATSVAGADRYATAAAVARTFFTNPATVTVASGWSFADALPGASMTKAGGPLLLANRDALPLATSDYLASVKTSLLTVSVIGGPETLPDSIVTAIKSTLGQ